MSKLPQITVYFWIAKICATTLGETVGDLVSMTLNVGYAVSSILLVGFFLVTLALQLGFGRYRPLLYWTVILYTAYVENVQSKSAMATASPGAAKEG